MSQVTNTKTTSNIIRTDNIDTTKIAGAKKATPTPAQQQVGSKSVSSQMKDTFERLFHMTDTNVKMFNQSLDISAFEEKFAALADDKQEIKEAYYLVKFKMEEVNITLAELDAKNIQDVIHGHEKDANGTKGYAKVDRLVKDNVEAQYKLKSALSLFAERTGQDFSAQMKMCDRKISATLNFVGKMMTHALAKQPDSVGEKRFSDYVSEMSLSDFGVGLKNISDGIVVTINQVAAKLDAMETGSHILSEKEFSSTMQTINNNINTISNKIENLQKENADLDLTHLNALQTSLNCAKERLNVLASTNKDQGINQLLSSFEDHYVKSGEKIMEFANSLTGGHLIKDIMIRSFANIKNINNILHSNPLDVDALLDAIDTFESNQSEISEATILECMKLAKEPDDAVFAEKIQETTYNAHSYARPYIKSFVNPLRNYEKANPGTISKLSFVYNPTLRRESWKLVTAFSEKPTDIHKTGEFIDSVFNSPVNISTMLEMKMRGFPLKDAVFNAFESNLIEEKKLGQGAANEVFLCTYAQNGEEVKYVFKGEYDARKGLDELKVGKLGYHSNVYINSLNVAATEVSELIGCESAIAQSKVGMHKNQFGLFMNVAKGSTLYALRRMNDPVPVANIGGKDITLQDLGAFLDEEQQKMLVASLAKELTKLEWSDALTAQVDRHADNYLLALDPTTFKASITGIDNDACFSRRMVGLGKIIVDSKLYEFGSKDAKSDFEAIKYKTGVNQAFKPLFISQEIYDKLHSIKEADYKKLLSKRIGASEVNSAMLRLKDAKKYAENLKAKGLCFNDHEWSSPQLFKALNQAMKDQISEYKSESVSVMQRNFITRDFESLKAVIENLALNK